MRDNEGFRKGIADLSPLPKKKQSVEQRVGLIYVEKLRNMFLKYRKPKREEEILN